MSAKNWLEKILSQLAIQLEKFSRSKKYIDQLLGDRDISELIRGSSIALIFKILSLPIGLVTSLIISRWYGADAMGLYGLIITVVGILTSIGMLGLSAAMPRFLGEARASKNTDGKTKIENTLASKGFDDEQAIYRTSLRMILISGVVGSGLLYFCSGWIALGIFDEPRLVFPLQISALFVIPLMIQSLNTSFLLAAKKIYHSELISKGIVPLAMLAIVIVSFRIRPTYYIPIWAYLLSGGLGMVVSFYTIQKHQNIRFKGILHNWRIIFNISSPMLMTGMIGLIISHSDIIMVGSMMDTVDVGIYKIILLLAAIITIGSNVLDGVFMPHIAEMFYRNKWSTIQKYIRTYNIANITIGVLMMIVITVLGKNILGYYGDIFIQGYYALVIIAGCLTGSLMMGPSIRYLNATGREKINLLIVSIGGLCNILLNLFLINRYGILGAAIGYGVSTLVIYISTSIYIYKKDRFWIGIKAKA